MKKIKRRSILSNQKIFIEKIMGDLEGDCINRSVDKVEKRILVLQKKKELDVQKKKEQGPEVSGEAPSSPPAEKTDLSSEEKAGPFSDSEE